VHINIKNIVKNRRLGFRSTGLAIVSSQYILGSITPLMRLSLSIETDPLSSSPTGHNWSTSGERRSGFGCFGSFRPGWYQ